MTRTRNFIFALLGAAILGLGSLQGARIALANEDGVTFQPMRAGNDRKRLDLLYGELAKSPDESTAKSIANDILEIWARSGSDTVDLLTRRARVTMESADDDATKKLLDAVVEIAPNFAEGWNRRATYYFTRKDYPKAMADVQRVLALDPRHFGALSGLGAMLEESGQDAAALDVYRQALKIYPYLPGARRAADDLEVEVEGRQI